MVKEKLNASAEELIEKYADTVYRVAYARLQNRADAQDAMQEVFLRYIRSNKKFESGEHVKAWLLKTAVNYVKTTAGSAYRKDLPLDDNNAVFIGEKSEVYYAVRQLSDVKRTVVHLFYYEDLPIKEISELLKMNESTVKSHLQRAREQLKELLLKGEYNEI